MQERNIKFASPSFPAVSINQFPLLTVDEMREVDRIMVEDIGISLDQMMENAGHLLADFVRFQFGSSATLCILAGKGNNGGGGLVAARHLVNRGHQVQLILATPGHYFREIPMQQLRIVNNMRIPILHGWEEGIMQVLQKKLQQSTVIIDALIGYSLVGKPQDVYATLINQANQSQTPIISLDAPSGLNLATGQRFDPTIQASATFTLAAPKVGLVKGQGEKVTGDIFVADISVPDVVWEEMDYQVNGLFQQSPILQLKI